MARKKRAPGEPITIKKYANRRLYNTETSSYVTLDHLANLIQQGEDFVVYDAKTSEDLTRTVLAQIIYEKEAHTDTMLPISFLRHLISFYGDSLEAMIPTYLQGTMDILKRHQEQLRGNFSSIDHEKFMPLFEELIRQNVAFFEQTMQMAVVAGEDKQAIRPNSEKNGLTGNNGGNETEIAALKDQLAILEEKIDSLTSQPKDS